MVHKYYCIGAVVKLSCKKADETSLVQESKTNRKGNFLIKKPKQLTEEQFAACKVYLVSSSSSVKNSCNKPTDLNFGISGSALTQMQKINTKKTLKYDYFTIKPFAFESSANESCQEDKMESSNYEIDEVICNPQCVLINYGCYCWNNVKLHLLITILCAKPKSL